MQIEKEECENSVLVLEKTKKALLEKDGLNLRELSDRTIHSSCFYQNEGSITTAVLIYALAKIVERGDYQKIKSWDRFVKRINSYFDLAISSLKKQKIEAYERHLERARKSLETISINLKPYIQEVMKKSSINKAAKIHEHGLSIGKTAHLLGVSQWELSEYAGQKTDTRKEYNETITVKKRAKMALEFFS